MRTTVTIDADTEHLLKREVARTGQSFKKILNQSIRRGLTQYGGSKVKVEPLFHHPFPPELAKANMNHLTDALDDEDTLRELSR